MSIYIHGLGHFHPENIITNQFLEDLDIDTNDSWIVERVGIKTRRTVLPLDYIKQTKNKDVRAASEVALHTNRSGAKIAATKALNNAGIRTDQIGMVIVGGCSPDTVTPAESCSVANELGIEQAKCVDINSACSSFGVQMHFISMMKLDALPDFVLLVSPENNTRTVDYSDRNTAVLWGDGTSAVIISTRIESSVQAKHISMQTDPKGWDKVMIPRCGHFTQEGKTVQSFAIRRTLASYEAVKSFYANELNKKLFFIGHQANLRMLESVCRRSDIKKDRHLFNVNDFGNTGAAGAPNVLSQYWNNFEKDDVVALSVVGSGLTWSSMAIEFN